MLVRIGQKYEPDDYRRLWYIKVFNGLGGDEEIINAQIEFTEDVLLRQRIW
jgi:hypothetical protein